MDVILLTSYVLVTKLVSFVCKRVYTYRGGSDHTIVHCQERDDPATGLEVDGGAEGASWATTYRQC